MTKSFLFWALALSLVQAPFILSLSCDSISSQNKDLCNSILQMNLTEEEKSLLITNLDYTNNLYPDHFLVYTHNNNIAITSQPSGIQSISKTYIKNAWSSIFTLMPSVIYNNSLYSPPESEVLTGFNYNIEIPNGYTSPGYPTTSGGDCQRAYIILQNTAKNNIYVNSILFGEGKSVRITLNNDSKIVSNYSILFTLRIDHTKWRSYCCKKRNGRCTKTCYSCDSKNSEIKEESVSILTEKDVKYYPNNLFAEITDLKQNANSNEIKLNYSDSVLLDFESSSFVFYKYAYSLSYSFPPYNVYTILARDLKQISSNNLIYTNKVISVKYISNCSLSAYDFFNKLKYNCSLENSKLNLSISTNDTFYNLGEKIYVSIFPDNISVNLTYGNLTILAKRNASLNAKQEYNKITASYNGETAEKVIFVSDNSRIFLIYKLLVACIIFILIYKVIKKYWRFT